MINSVTIVDIGKLTFSFLYSSIISYQRIRVTKEKRREKPRIYQMDLMFLSFRAAQLLLLEVDGDTFDGPCLMSLKKIYDLTRRSNSSTVTPASLRRVINFPPSKKKPDEEDLVSLDDMLHLYSFIKFYEEAIAKKVVETINR